MTADLPAAADNEQDAHATQGEGRPPICHLCGPGYRIGDDGCRHPDPSASDAHAGAGGEGEGLRELAGFRQLGAEIHHFRCSNPDCRHHDDPGYFTPRDNDAASAVFRSGWLSALLAAHPEQGTETGR